MSASTARQITKVENGMVTVVDPNGVEHIEQVANLKRPELLRALKVAKPEANGKSWFGASQEELAGAIANPSEAPATYTKPGRKTGEARTNTYPGTCTVCGTRVGEGEGTIVRNPVEGAKPRWLTYCKDHSAEAAQAEGERPGKGEATTQVPQGTQVATEAQEAPQGSLEAQVRAIAEDVVSKAPGVTPEQLREAIETAIDRRVPVVHEVRTPERVLDLPEYHHPLLPLVIQCLEAGEHVFLVGPAGSGKSTLAIQAFTAIGLDSRSFSFGPTTPTSRLFGFKNADGEPVRTDYWDAVEYGKGFLGDEIDNGHPGLVAELNQSLANGTTSFAGGQVQNHEAFRFVATGNTWGMGPDRMFVGRNILDAATLDRFTQIEVPYDEVLERQLALAWASTEELQSVIGRWVDRVQEVRRVVFDQKLKRVVGPRASIGGAKLLATGIPWETVESIRLTPGWSPEHLALI